MRQLLNNFSEKIKGILAHCQFQDSQQFLIRVSFQEVLRVSDLEMKIEIISRRASANVHARVAIVFETVSPAFSMCLWY